MKLIAVCDNPAELAAVRIFLEDIQSPKFELLRRLGLAIEEVEITYGGYYDDRVTLYPD